MNTYFKWRPCLSAQTLAAFTPACCFAAGRLWTIGGRIFERNNQPAARTLRRSDRAGAGSGRTSPQGTELSWGTNPPAEGPHYPVWAPWAQAFTDVVPRGNWLHNAEHGGIVLLYRCPGGCPEVVAGLTDMGMALPQDPACERPINARWVLTQDPLLPDGVQVAAVAWGYAYRASCVDRDTLQAFITTHYAHAPEDFCSQGALAWR